MHVAYQALVRVLIYILLLVGLAACGPATMYPKVDPEAVEAELKTQKRLRIQEANRYNRRLREIGNRVLSAGTFMCGGKVDYYTGFSVATIYDLEKEIDKDNSYYESYKEYYGLGKRCSVTDVDKGSPADLAGLKRKDIVLKVDGEDVPQGFWGSSYAPRWVDEAVWDKEEVTLEVERDGKPLSITIRARQQCDYGLAIMYEDIINAYTDSESIYMYTGMMDALPEDDDLALIMGHELAHCTMGHTKVQAVNRGIATGIGAIVQALTGVENLAGAMGAASRYVYSHERELEADYVGLYYAARAGYDISDAADSWRKLAAQSPAYMRMSPTHPSSAERFLTMEKVIREIRRKQALGLPMAPTMRTDSLSATLVNSALPMPEDNPAEDKPVEDKSVDGKPGQAAQEQTVDGSASATAPAAPEPQKAKTAERPSEQARQSRQSQRALPLPKSRTLFPAN